MADEKSGSPSSSAKVTEYQREPARVREAKCGLHEHYSTIVGEVALEGPSGGWGQTFGQICLDPPASEAFTREVCDLFGVKTLAECAGRNCFALRSWPGMLGLIEGLEVDGRRFTMTGFRRRHYPENAETPIERRVSTLRASIDRAAADIQRWNREIERVDEGYIEWEDSNAR